ncbi:MAG: hypothetical protein INQ03_14360 [Candidatus Heimdallarchaeota archaeon]|nr:hypothetical protein [Candidatus Heimdallarchaeota archaeon]
MSRYIADLLTVSIWEIIFTILFFLGLIFTIYIIFGALHHGDTSDQDGHDGDHGDGHDGDHGDIHDADHPDDLGDLDSDISSDLHLDMDADIDTFDVHVDIHDIGDITAFKNRSYELKSNFALGNISVFMLITGQIGWIYVHELTDLIILIAIVSGFITSKLFALVISKYTTTVVVPLVQIAKGDIAEVKYQVTHQKSGLVNVRRRDGVIDPVMAIGAFPHDNFEAGDLGYIIGKKEAFYLITRGRMELEKKEDKKKALD